MSFVGLLFYRSFRVAATGRLLWDYQYYVVVFARLFLLNETVSLLSRVPWPNLSKLLLRVLPLLRHLFHFQVLDQK